MFQLHDVHVAEFPVQGWLRACLDGYLSKPKWSRTLLWPTCRPIQESLEDLENSKDSTYLSKLRNLSRCLGRQLAAGSTIPWEQKLFDATLDSGDDGYLRVPNEPGTAVLTHFGPVSKLRIATSAWFLDEKQSQLQTLREAGGGIVQLLEAYLNMVGDIQYSPVFYIPLTSSFSLGVLQAREKLSSSGHASDEDEEGQELDVSDTAILPTTPISNAPPLPPAPFSNSTLIPPSSPAGVAPPPSPSQPSHLRRDLREGGTVHDPRTMERRSLFLPHPNAPKTPKDLGGEGNPGLMYVRDCGTPPGSAIRRGDMPPSAHRMLRRMVLHLPSRRTNTCSIPRSVHLNQADTLTTTSDVQAWASSPKPGQAGPSKAGPSRAHTRAYRGFGPGFKFCEAQGQGLSPTKPDILGLPKTVLRHASCR
ncbi:hypothetical protein BKA70DRAFT_1532496 [Coprinopsis sp. MPI-PUGE-AT-0042]|nr:hypothetical protein BKA70DRAFT_1532496 [Coprinopsis sp. MPI-PUGE-AT-0042]